METSQRAPAFLATLLACTLLAACGGKNTGSKVEPPGSEITNETRALEAGASLLQDKTPLKKLNAYLDGFHFASGNLQQQMEAHHYCGHLNEDVIQCALFDGNGEDAKLIGIEYIISAKLFVTLPADEKHLWHSHVHEVQSGQLIAPGIPDVAEQELMQQIAGTYGKTWHTWHTDDRQALPLGVPMLMMGFTRDGQLDEARVRERDQRFDVSSGRKRDDRKDLNYPIVDTDADAWQKGIAVQVEARPVPIQPAKP
ncbi:MAG TPA: OBAP family protein [Steroidobacteraceae bacterium]|nr:OBAP family protein [Steroidobacteraceae bacterium]